MKRKRGNAAMVASGKRAILCYVPDREWERIRKLAARCDCKVATWAARTLLKALEEKR